MNPERELQGNQPGGNGGVVEQNDPEVIPRVEGVARNASRPRGRPPGRGGRRGGNRGGITGRTNRDDNRNSRRDERLEAQQEEPVPPPPPPPPPPPYSVESLTGYSTKAINCGLKFDVEMSKITTKSCTNCKRAFLELPLKDGLCSVCQKDPQKLTDSNNMDPGPIPPELQDLTYIEQMLIAQIHPVVNLYRLKGAQTGYKGNVISFKQDIYEYSKVLPQIPTDLVSTILFSKETPSGTSLFKARPQKLRDALNWLKDHNPYYGDITISEEHLSQIPDDGDLTQLLHSCGMDFEDNDEQDDFLEESYVPLFEPIDRQQVLRSKLKLPYPTTERTPINEFDEDGFIARAFPVLFPTGKGDFNYKRNQQPSLDEYFKFLLQYPDRRFIHDPRFCFFAMNMSLRRNALRQVGIYVQKTNLAPLYAKDIRERIENDANVLKRIMVSAAKIRSTKYYWGQRCAELFDMVLQIGPPTIFFTLTAADYHWPDLFRLLAPDKDPETLSPQERKDLMHNNPDIVGYFFKRRCEIFIKTVLTPLFGVEDYWYRYEWQMRGSPHLHGLLWLKDSPSVNQQEFSDEEIENIRQYFDRLCSAINPKMDQTWSTNPCRKRFSDIDPEKRDEDLDQLLNYFQRHNKCNASCLRKYKNDPNPKCRFKFPIEERPESVVKFNDDGTFEFYPKRNDSLLSRYHALITQIWRANTDFSPVTSIKAVLNYIAKYASKGETASKTFKEMITQALLGEADDVPAKKIFQRAVITTFGERNYSGQETHHLVQGWDLYSSTRSFVVLCLYDDEWHRLQVDDETAKKGKDYLEKYRERPAELENLTVMEFVKRWYTKKVGDQIVYVQRVRKDAIARIFPRPKLLQEDDANNEKFYKLHVLLRVPFREGPFDNLLRDTENNITYASWKDRYESLNITVDEIPELEEEEEIPLEAINDDDQVDPFMVAARMINHRENENVPERGKIGTRAMDLSFDWLNECKDYPPIEEVQNFLKSYKNNGVVGTDDSSSNENPLEGIVLSTEQQKVLDICGEQISFLKDGIGDPPKQVMVQGKAGCGKSTLIKAIVHKVKQSFDNDESVILVAAPTGLAAINIDGRTIHSILRLPYKPMSGQGALTFQALMEKVKFLITDEMSLIGVNLMYYIDKRCRESRPRNSSEPFGGLMIYLFGDIQQLPPVADSACYSSKSYSIEAIGGRLAFSAFKTRIRLTQCHRQSGSGEEGLRNFLDNLGVGKCTQEGYDLIMTRREVVLTAHEKARFKHATHLYNSNVQAKEENDRYLEDTKLPVARILSRNEPDLLHDVEGKQSGLPHELNLTIGCNVMLRVNLWVDARLVNGATGVVKAIVYGENTRPTALPKYILVEFPEYKGPFFPHDKLFPVVPITKSWVAQNITYTRTQFPLSLSHAMSIHKSQGLTLPMVVVDLGNKEQFAGSSYVALSRVRKLEDILIKKTVPKSRFDSIGRMKVTQEKNHFLSHF